ncbi:16S rRNA (guanine(966)-N(2))-methyltransferase RsmD [Caldimonas thermodepolymerans]|jgi:RNA methyltransferase, RsmD family|uniref:16S rRNA (Guanine(966)-N(2))-methyltransferase RsmD n=1 Tax=Caldimonas thermodepolymerans TaxID=215580 RepID=A0A2S5T3M5_9BURK|nr:16S rRNA (guanine(966)-N(2))-methyltransferase RsmD [Caldimonas thermodepolymerans]PPE69529.1 16S rRNA (guanine(966)-N(2))-methyltransferase RsmD [Caldimonas thermodepolymerans]QPC30956.1 16S rRNA (guanine(966)-N(2))-methyltransferase RsmD [Caldimonas thermodepolymerans]RDH97030.1 16S rRNA (guanine(966)-N(2))-methyltransferase RsmD [Caldimonas thermodepolymerans]TCP09067.1 16S rRNA (guanine(966)-N(2))-methyltransferase RsmD [Caldimonas thermodepolymerans]UZG43698.1 16S rRNA (guanine(966)-N(
MATRSPRSSPPREVRIIGGQWKRTKLPVADKPGLRPTLDRVRETLFNWLGQDLAGWRCLDAFAGTGALGFEAASRGATEVVLLEQDAMLVAQLHALKQRLRADAVQVVRGDALAWMRRVPEARFDLVLLDPPFAAGLFEAALREAARLVVPDGYVYLEADAPPEAALLEALGLQVHRSGRAGTVHFHLLRPVAGR